jgi:nitrous oxide reductase accessory protein NosL
MSRTRFSILAMSILLAACATEQQRKAQENAAIRKQAAREIERICALPEPDRQAEIEKIKEQSGMVIYCGNP